jgi:hypothetical protein
MSKRIILPAPAVSIGLLATALMLGTDCATLAGDDCLAGPNRPPAQGGHWYYRLDRAKNRQCWYLVEPAAQTPTAQAAQPQPAPDPTPQRTLDSFFSSLSSSFTGSTTGSQPDTASDARIMQPAHPDDLETDGASRGRQPRRVRRPDSQAALALKQHRPAHARPLAEHAEERPPLNQAERDALFQEFLRWRESR